MSVTVVYVLVYFWAGTVPISVCTKCDTSRVFFVSIVCACVLSLKSHVTFINNILDQALAAITISYKPLCRSVPFRSDPPVVKQGELTTTN